VVDAVRFQINGIYTLPVVRTAFPSKRIALPGALVEEQAAYFAWQEFIALNWPAQAKYNNNAPRDTPDKTLPFGDSWSPVERERPFRRNLKTLAVGRDQGRQRRTP